MSTQHADVEQAVSSCRPADVDPVEIRGEDLESTAPEYLRDLKDELTSEGYQPAALVVEGCFAEDCSLATQEEADRLREYVRAAAFLGTGRVTVEVSEVADASKVAPALSALRERAEREGVRLSVAGVEAPV